MGFFGLTSSKPARKGSKAAKTQQAVIPIRDLAKQSPFNKVCLACTLNKEAKNLTHPKMEPTGTAKPLVYVLGEAPGENEDRLGEQFVGKSGELIRDLIPDELEGRVRWSNTVQCRPPGNRTPTPSEMACCSNRVEQDILKTKPKVIIGFGAVPLRWAVDETYIGDWRGDIVPIRVGTHECWYAAMWHPAFILRKRNDRKDGESYARMFDRDVNRAFAFALSNPEPPYIPTAEECDSGIRVLTDWKLSTVEKALADLHSTSRGKKHQSIDIETNGLRPYFNGAKVLSVSFGTWEHSVAIPLAHRESKWSPEKLAKLWALLGEYMRQCEDTRFWAHHLKFEQEWLSMPWAMGRDILFEANWDDTMAQAHVMSSKGLSGLSLNSRCKALFGVPEKSLDALDRSRLDEYPVEKVLRYNARDTKFTDLVRRFQMPLIKDMGLTRAYRVIRDRVPALTIAQQDGVVPNTSFAEAKHLELQGQLEQIAKKIQTNKDVVAFVKDRGKPFNPASNPQLVAFFRDHLGHKEGAQGDGKYSTDESVLSRIRHPVAAGILEQRGLTKLDSTYVAGVCAKKEGSKDLGKLIWDDGLIHTTYNYLKTSTGRLSSEDPNLQNFPKRQHKEIRAVIKAAKGCLVVSIDYGQIEFRVIGMASGCAVIAEALWHHSDVHMVWAKKIVKRFPKKLDSYLRETDGDDVKALKLFRSDIKNEWTFPLFYGSTLNSVSAALELNQDSLSVLYEAFWREFSAVRKWQKRVDSFYRQNGYVETLTGRRRYGPLGYNEEINSPIQGTASDIVVDGMVQLAWRSYKEKRPQLAARLNIHDDLTFYLPKKTLEDDLESIVETMVTPRFEFINVPLTVEVAVGPNWADLTEVTTIESTEYGHSR